MEITNETLRNGGDLERNSNNSGGDSKRSCTTSRGSTRSRSGRRSRKNRYPLTPATINTWRVASSGIDTIGTGVHFCNDIRNTNFLEKVLAVWWRCFTTTTSAFIELTMTGANKLKNYSRASSTSGHKNDGHDASRSLQRPAIDEFGQTSNAS